ncbi:hypothetical protein TWF730_009163 [Orbilia blumenaviensis]|uniref:DUF7029 domain-containing protein n=1 Tax=Orbilia blumenaviensis TaxID=1796055 RepID=A0AAV9UY66_9PEZI
MVAFGLTLLSLGLLSVRAQAAEWHTPSSHGTRSIKHLPIREEYLKPHLQKRADDVSRLFPQNQIQMYFGRAISDAHLRVSDMTIKNKDHPMILLENFDDLTESIVCTGGDQEITLKFKTRDGMNAAIAAWDWVNDKEADYFTLITHHHHTGCGPDEERMPYKVTDVKYDETNLKAVLTKEKASWDETLRTFDMTIDTVDHPMKNLDKRFLGVDLTSPFRSLARSVCGGKSGTCSTIVGYVITPPIVRAIQGVGDTIETGVQLLGDGVKKTMQINWGKDDPNHEESFTELFKAPAGIDISGKVACKGCYLKGDVNLKVEIRRINGETLPSIVADFASTVKGRLAMSLTGTVGKEMDFNIGALVGNTLLAEDQVDKIIKVVPEVALGPGLLLKAEASTSVELPPVDIDMKDFKFQVSFGLSGPSFELPPVPENSFKKSADFRWTGIDWTGEVDIYNRVGFGLGVEFLGGDGPIPLGMDPGTKVGIFAGIEDRLDNAVKGTHCEGEEANKSVTTIINTDKITVSSEYKLNVRLRPMLELELGNWFKSGFINGQIEQTTKDLIGGQLFDGCTISTLPLATVTARDICSEKRPPVFAGPQKRQYTKWNDFKTCMGTLGDVFLPDRVPSWYPGKN